jgi:hypothetical protein
MYDEIIKQIKSCKEKMLKLSESVENYISEHNTYFWNKEKDATLLKEKIKEKIIGVINED